MFKFACLALLLTLASTYSTLMAHDMAFLSDIAYQSLANINAWSCSDCAKYDMKNQKGFYSSTANIQGYAGHLTKDSAVVVSFRGSVDFKNWVYNLDTTSTTYPSCTGCAVHSGFYNAYKGVSPLVRTEVSRLLSLYKTAKLIIVGHSLGGAMAIHCALEMKELYGKVDYVYTYGQPRVGNAAFAAFYETRIPNSFRVINYADMVPHVPPSSFNFKHGGNEMWYNPRGMKTYKHCVSEDKACANSMVASGLSTDDHNLSYYKELAVTMINPKNLKQESAQPMPEEEFKQTEERRVMQIKGVIANQME